MYYRWIWTILFLICCSITDIKIKKVYVKPCIVNLFVVISIRLMENFKNLNDLVIGILPGLIVLIISIITNKIGEGDALVIANIGALLGFKVTVAILVWAFICESIYGIAGVLIKKLHLKDKVAFIPFLLTGAVIMLIILK